MTRTAARERASHRCSECGVTVTKWVGRCPECQAWGTIAETGATRVRAVAGPVSSPARPINDVDVEQARSRPTGEAELDRVLGGGLVPGAVVLLAGEPGAGKSTLSLAVAARYAHSGAATLYVTGEESAAQVRLRAGRTGALAEKLWVAAETDLGAVLAHVEAVQPELLIVDSVQTIATPDVEGTAGGVTQVRAVSAALIAVAKERGIATVLVGHVTKDGSIAGPRLLEHLVDVVLHFEGDRHSTLRLLRAVKNRYGAADEIGCFQMTETGIEGLADPSGLFLSRGDIAVPGTCVTVTLEGRRPLLAEVQALVTDPSKENSPRRAVSGLESGRVAMVLAVAEKRAGAKELGRKDVHTATVGGVDVGDPAADLALLLAVESAMREQAVPGGLVALGEVGLSGEIRPVGGVPRRLAEAARLGFTHAIVPRGSGPAPAGISVREVGSVDEAVAAARSLAGRARRTVPKP
ncbi:MAG TPA: DNA repair protein RadA [Mycobacteriales bacterium]|nr:DNA repair protein RadA [Mycobacteriales bacterium]